LTATRRSSTRCGCKYQVSLWSHLHAWSWCITRRLMQTRRLNASHFSKGG